MLTVWIYFLGLVEVVCCLLLIGLVLIQRGKSQGVGLAFGGGMGETLFGARVGNVLTRATVVLTTIFLLNTALLSLVASHRRTRSLADSVRPAPAAPAAEAPASPEALPAPSAPEAAAPAAEPSDSAAAAPAAEAPAPAAELPAAAPAE